ncbi:hypothetical protein A3841_01200 [Pontibacter flavimaris]|uniref:Uncharacterized protein n=1 Tax=Pontibacter flavimaris TaxID=1797110 RepID=A0A1Q5PBM3_9BACT|nr:hypothetical protein A3841_01200 [Pontibacter flavimaris]
MRQRLPELPLLFLGEGFTAKKQCFYIKSGKKCYLWIKAALLRGRFFIFLQNILHETGFI